MPLRYIGAFLLTLLVATVLSLSCADPDGSAGEDSIVREGRQLAKKHCQTCHEPVSPSSLDRETWVNGVLPAMAPKFGIQVLWENEYYKPVGSAQRSSSDSTLTLSEWRKIVAYFRSEAPDTLRLPPPPEHLQRDLSLFSVRKPSVEARRRFPATAMVAIDSLHHHIYTSDVTSGRLYRWNQELQRTPIESPSMKGVEVQFIRDSTGNRHAVFTSIGTMRAVNVATGKVWDLNLNTGSGRFLARQLPRPVCARPGDFDRDGRRDWVVCGFGHDTGGLYLYEQQPDRTYKKTILRPTPGAVDAQTVDFNNDGWLDVMVLFGHSKEGVWLFLNDRNGEFEQKNLVRFPPHYGSSSLQIADFNDDARPDLLYTSGDNADYSNILKKFHGVYIYVNKGGFEYEKRYFYHFNGATEAIAEDFDEDGDLDIGLIGFFADIQDRLAQDVVYLEQEGDMDFLPHALPIEEYGRWISMDAEDYDGDDDVDLVLGNFARRYSGKSEKAKTAGSRLPFLVLENRLRP